MEAGDSRTFQKSAKKARENIATLFSSLARSPRGRFTLHLLTFPTGVPSGRAPRLDCPREVGSQGYTWL